MHLTALTIRWTACYPVRIVDEIADPWYPIDATKVWAVYATERKSNEVKNETSFLVRRDGVFCCWDETNEA